MVTGGAGGAGCVLNGAHVYQMMLPYLRTNSICSQLLQQDICEGKGQLA